MGSSIVSVVSYASAVAPSNTTAFAAFMVTVSTTVCVPVTVRLPPTDKSVPTYSFLAILAPPSVRNAPVSPVALEASVASVTSRTPDVVIAPEATVPRPETLPLVSKV